ncbi:MAG: hypothetical protein ACMXX9_00590 [Candidatus Woesearchaeota archaeon]
MKELTDYVKEAASKYESKSQIIGGYDSPLFISTDQPSSNDQAIDAAAFWSEVLTKSVDLGFDKNIESLSFVYQEHDFERPLPMYKKAANSLGFNFEPIVEEGKIKNGSFKPSLLRGVVYNKAMFLAKEPEWKKMNKLSKTTNDIIAPNALNISPFNYQVHIPLELILNVNFKQESNYSTISK